MLKTVTQVYFAPKLAKRLRTAAYARVSSGKDAMLHSLSAQISYYSQMIQSRLDWDFAGVYVDQAVTGTRDSRSDFQRLLADCRAGKIDLVITKSLARFARNTVTLLETIRELKLLGIDIYFEQQNMHSISPDGEFMLTILAAYAQEESLNVSENCKWRIQRMFKQGRPNFGKLLGYRLYEGKFYIVPEEAELVRRIYDAYLAGMGRSAIARWLNQEGIAAPRGGNWGESTISGVLRNEKYTGNMLLQKFYNADHISKQKRCNRGERPQFFVESSHEAIIAPDTFEAVQREIARRAEKYQPSPKRPRTYPFTKLIRCGNCGAAYNRKHANAGGKYEKVVWICDTFNTHGKAACPSQQIPEAILMAKTEEAGGFEGLIEIYVPERSHLSFVYADGRRVDLAWQYPPRSQSWTPEMKEAARRTYLAWAFPQRKEMEASL